MTRTDDQPPWWAIDIGNQGNYVLNSANGLKSGILGPYTNRSRNDIGILEDFMSNPAPPGSTPRAVVFTGNLVESEWRAGGIHRDLLTNYTWASA